MFIIYGHSYFYKEGKHIFPYLKGNKILLWNTHCHMMTQKFLKVERM